MRKFNTQGIILTRTNYGEADRIITFLTPHNGKVRVMAKGVRKTKSKLAGGVELFSISDIGILPGRGEISTLMSSRLVKHYGQIVKDLDRTNLAYQLIKELNKATEDQPEEAYFNLLQQAFEALDDHSISLDLIQAWFGAQLLKLSGHAPNLRTDKAGSKLMADKKYDFSYDSMSFEPGKAFSADHIKFLRLLFSGNQPAALQKVNQLERPLSKAKPLIQSVLQVYIRI